MFFILAFLLIQIKGVRTKGVKFRLYEYNWLDLVAKEWFDWLVDWKIGPSKSPNDQCTPKFTL